MNPVLADIAGFMLGNLPTLQTTYDLTKQCVAAGVPGAFVECGVYAGAHPAAMYRGVRDAKGDPRVIHLFDSFEGIPIAGPEDHAQPGVGQIPEEEKTGELKSSGISICSMAQVQEYMHKWRVDASWLRYHPGWFQDTVPVSDTGDIAILRLDGDLYESTKVCMEHLYPRLVTGGYCIIDDYALPGCRKAVDSYLREHDIRIRMHEIPDSAGVVWWQAL